MARGSGSRHAALALLLCGALAPRGAGGALTMQEVAECEATADLYELEMRGGVVVEMLLFLYAIIIMFVLIEEWYVPALELASDQLRVPRPLLGCTIMAAGNCLPELSMSLVAILFSGSADIGTGEVFGSCVFDLLAILGAVCVRLPPEGARLATPLMTYFVAWTLIATALDVGLFYSTIDTAWPASIGMVTAYVAFVVGLFALNKCHPNFAVLPPDDDAEQAEREGREAASAWARRTTAAVAGGRPCVRMRAAR